MTTTTDINCIHVLFVSTLCTCDQLHSSLSFRRELQSEAQPTASIHHTHRPEIMCDEVCYGICQLNSASRVGRKLFLPLQTEQRFQVERCFVRKWLFKLPLPWATFCLHRLQIAQLPLSSFPLSPFSKPKCFHTMET